MDEFRLENKVALITGASKGIGEAIAIAFATHGAKVVINSRKQEFRRFTKKTAGLRLQRFGKLTHYI